MARTPEGKIKDKTTAILKKYDIWYFFPQAGVWGKAGIPDIIAAVNGMFWGLEVKANEKKKPTKLQSETMKDITKSGGYCMVIDGQAALDKLEINLKKELGERC